MCAECGEHVTWTYDRYGNRTAQTVTAGSGPSLSATADANTNRITAIGMSSLSYDASGNLTQDDLYKYVYDAENNQVQLQQLTGATIASYTFDGNGLRVIKVAGTSRTYSIYDGSALISEFSDASSATYTAGTTPHQAPADSVSLLLYQHPDHLSVRATTDNSGNTGSLQAHYPYGEPWYDTGAASGSVIRKYASYYKDAESASALLNYAVFREHSARLARFLAPAPHQATAPSAQAFNGYGYCPGDPFCFDPIAFVSPGLYGFCAQQRRLDLKFEDAGVMDNVCLDLFDDLLYTSFPEPDNESCFNVKARTSDQPNLDCNRRGSFLRGRAYLNVSGQALRGGLIQNVKVSAAASNSSASVLKVSGTHILGHPDPEGKDYSWYADFDLTQGSQKEGGLIEWTVEWTCSADSDPSKVYGPPKPPTTLVKCRN